MTTLEETFQKMEKELEQLNKDFSAGKNPPRPQYDPKLFREFRDWQQDRLDKKVKDIQL